MDTTPELPPEIRDFTDPEKTCTNVYEILPNETKLYGTESLVDEKGVTEPTWKYGYWKTAELLLLAQDPSNFKTIQERSGDGHPDPFCAVDWRKKKDGFETNRNLHWLAQQIDCRKLYGSVFVGLLKHTKNRSGKPVKSSAVEKYKKAAFRWVLAHTPNLRAIACLGISARDFVAEGLLDPNQSRELKRGVGSAVHLKDLYVIHLMHPGFWTRLNGGCGPRAWVHWQKLARDCDFGLVPEPWEWEGP